MQETGLNLFDPLTVIDTTPIRSPMHLFKKSNTKKWHLPESKGAYVRISKSNINEVKTPSQFSSITLLRKTQIKKKKKKREKNLLQMVERNLLSQ